MTAVRVLAARDGAESFMKGSNHLGRG